MYRLYEDGTDIVCSEMSARKIQTPGNHPKERIQHSEHGDSLKSRMLHLSVILGVIYGVKRMPFVETTPHRLSMSVLPSVCHNISGHTLCPIVLEFGVGVPYKI
jgi:hypothetical protein